MKTLQIKFKIIPLLLVIGLAFASCRNDKKGDSDLDSEQVDNTSTKDDDDGATATLSLADGKKLDFKSNFNNSASLMGQNLSIGFTNTYSGLTVYMMMMSHEALVPGNQNGYIKVSQAGDSDIIEETYSSQYNNESEPKKEGNSKLTITKIGKDFAQGTFSGTLYSKNGKKLTIKGGQFSFKKKK